jgi:pimeloyl-ACP methyl ester carboxylesterase
MAMQSVETEPRYEPRLLSRSTFVESGGLRLHVRLWGDPAANPLVLVHGAMDASITFQFLVDALQGDWFVVAPDLRGYGESERAPNYAFPDYLRDLEGVLDGFFPDRPVPLVGHSLGGNVVSVYAGVRPSRASHVVSLDGFGLPDRDPAEAPDFLARWLDRWAKPPGERILPSFEDLAARLQQTNPHLDQARALFLARHLGHSCEGGVTWVFDPNHRRPFAAMFREAEWRACLARVEAPVLWVGSGQTVPAALAREPGAIAGRAEAAHATFHKLEGTSHNLHHDAPEAVARLIEPFLRGQALSG